MLGHRACAAVRNKEAAECGQHRGPLAGANAGEAAPKVLLSEGKPEPLCLAELFSERWTQLVRSAPMDDVRGMGTRPLRNPIKPPKFGLNP